MRELADPAAAETGRHRRWARTISMADEAEVDPASGRRCPKITSSIYTVLRMPR
jgi:hypothetical protein